MNIHKFNVKPKATVPKTVQWRPLREVKYPARKVNIMTWEIFSQQQIKLDPKEVTIRVWVYDEQSSCFSHIS